jgi:DNA-binding response OmpR family regulator
LKILVIDDDEAVILFLDNLLTSLGFNVTFARDGEQGVKKFFQNPPAIALVDIYLPKKNGFLVAQEIRSKFPQSRLIMMSGLARKDNLKELSLPKFDDILMKPLNPSEVVRVLHKVLSESPLVDSRQSPVNDEQTTDDGPLTTDN